jgi:hypothetical protein
VIYGNNIPKGNRKPGSSTIFNLKYSHFNCDFDKTSGAQALRAQALRAQALRAQALRAQALRAQALRPYDIC